MSGPRSAARARAGPRVSAGLLQTLTRVAGRSGAGPVSGFVNLLKSEADREHPIAVGTLIAERPPHRSERAQFGHSAPTSGV